MVDFLCHGYCAFTTSLPVSRHWEILVSWLENAFISAFFILGHDGAGTVSEITSMFLTSPLVWFYDSRIVKIISRQYNN
jgi:hypothetical protein